jgi:hypothetical protein
MGNLGEAVEGWVQLGEWWLDSWSKHLGKIATKVDGGNYTSADATTDLVECASLAGETVLLLGNQVIEAAAVLTMVGPEPLETEPFQTKKLTSVRTLKLDGPLTCPLVADQIPAAAVTIDPDELKSNETSFRLRFDPTGFAGVAYFGTVGVYEKGTTNRVHEVTVVVQVP